MKSNFFFRTSLFAVCLGAAVLGAPKAEAAVNNVSIQPSFKGNTIYSNEKVQFKVVSPEATSHYKSIEWKNYKGSPFTNTAGSFSAFKEGNQTVSATLCLKSDPKNCQTLTFSFQVKNSAPDKPIIEMSPTKNYFRNTFIIFSHPFTIDHDNDPVTHEWKLDKGEWKTTPPTGTLPIGAHTIYIRAKDNKGNVSPITEKTFEVKNSAPTLPNVYLQPSGKLTSLTPLSFEAESSDVDWDPITIEWSKDNVNWSAKSPNGKFKDGDHSIYVRAKDNKGNVSKTAIKSFHVTNTPPSAPKITMTPKATADLDENTKLHFNIGGSVDADGDKIKYEWKVNKKDWTNKSIDGYYGRGSHVVSARAIDNKGNTSEVTKFEFQIKNLPPTKPKLKMSPEGTTFTTDDSFTFEGNGSTDPEGDEIVYEWKVNNEDWTEKKPNGKLPSGEYTISVRAKDTYSGVSEAEQVKFRVYSLAANIKPKPILTNKESTLTTKTKLTFDVQNPEKDIIWFWKVDNQMWKQGAPNGLYTKGKHTVSVKGKDAFGRYTTIEDITFTISNSPPVITSVSHYPEKDIDENTVVTFDVSATDYDNDNLTIYWKIDDGDWSQRRPDKAYSDGKHTVYVKAVDDQKSESEVASTSFTVNAKETEGKMELSFEGNPSDISFSGDWSKTGDQASDQMYSLKSSKIGNNSSSSSYINFTIPSDSSDGSVSFDYLIRSEDDADFLRVYIDGSLAFQDTGFGTWSGKNISLSPGSHTIEFRYVKDGNGSKYDDAAYIDNFVVRYKKQS